MATPPLTAEQLRDALPDTTSPLVVAGIEAPVEIVRDRLGIPHVRARSLADAFFGQGFAHAQDRLWHMDYDRHRAQGRWAELVGPSGVAQDTLMRRFRLAATARRDYDAVDVETRAMLDAYAAGVNAFIASTDRLPIEYTLLDTRPEPWQPWDGLAAYKVRHVMMGVWESKLWRARLVNQIGPEGTAALYGIAREGELLILPPGATYAGPTAAALDELRRGLATIDWLREADGGSNSWSVDGRRTASGRPLLAGDPHRAVEVPNVYYQNHVTGGDIDAIGLSFPGLPGFPHFGHNPDVAWCVTHTGADYQDLYVEQFDPADPARYRYRDEWRQAAIQPETIGVRGADPVTIEVVETHHGPIIAGDPASGRALAFRYTATLGPNTGWNCLLKMLRARSAAELSESMREWVDPVNNFLFADAHGAIGYRTRGQIPVRSALNAWLPAPGWTGEHEWAGIIPFEEMPAQIDPDTGYIVTANNRPVGADYPHFIGLHFASDDRARRITTRLLDVERHTVESFRAIHTDIVSIPAQELLPHLGNVPTRSELAARALVLLRAWDGVTAADQAAPLIFNALRDEATSAILRPLLGPIQDGVFASTGRGGPALAARVRRGLSRWVAANDTARLPAGTTWSAFLGDALERAVASLADQLGPAPEEWRWGQLHQLRPTHPLAPAFPGLAATLSPRPAPMGGDAETPQAASYAPNTGFTVTGASVARYVFDTSDWDNSGWVVPLGASGHPGSPHFADQQPTWLAHRLNPMLYSWPRVEADAESRQTLRPASPGS